MIVTHGNEGINHMRVFICLYSNGEKKKKKQIKNKAKDKTSESIVRLTISKLKFFFPNSSFLFILFPTVVYLIGDL